MYYINAIGSSILLVSYSTSSGFILFFHPFAFIWDSCSICSCWLQRDTECCTECCLCSSSVSSPILPLNRKHGSECDIRTPPGSDGRGSRVNTEASEAWEDQLISGGSTEGCGEKTNPGKQQRGVRDTLHQLSHLLKKKNLQKRFSFLLSDFQNFSFKLHVFKLSLFYHS